MLRTGYSSDAVLAEIARRHVLEPLDEEEAREVARTLKRRGVEAIAVCFINSYANPVHEQRMCEILREELETITNAKDRNAQTKNPGVNLRRSLFVNTGRAAGEDNAIR